MTSLFLTRFRAHTTAGCVASVVGVSLSFSFSSVDDESSWSTLGFKPNQKVKIIVRDRCGWAAWVLTLGLSGSRTRVGSEGLLVPSGVHQTWTFGWRLGGELGAFHLLPVVDSFPSCLLLEPATISPLFLSRLPSSHPFFLYVPIHRHVDRVWANSSYSGLKTIFFQGSRMSSLVAPFVPHKHSPLLGRVFLS